MNPVMLNRRWWVLAGTAALLCVLMLAGVALGATDLGIGDVIATLAGRRDDPIIWVLRLPRVLGAACVGGLLGLAGALLQGLFRNPLADPYLLGTSSGAALAVASLMIFGTEVFGESAVETHWLTVAAFAGALLAVVITVALARGGARTLDLMLSGIVIAVLLGAATTLVSLRDAQAWRAMQAFVLGSTAMMGWAGVALLAPVLVVCSLAGLAIARQLDALTLGDDTARSLGVRMRPLRWACLGIAVLATASSVAQAGIIGFVGLVAPHLARRMGGGETRYVVLASVLMGAALLVGADLLSRWLVRPSELPVGLATAVLGGAYMVGLLWRQRDARSL
jgi:iron complex transport system permease protein